MALGGFARVCCSSTLQAYRMGAAECQLGVVARVALATDVAGEGRRLTSILQDHGGKVRRREGSAGCRNYILISQGGQAENVRGVPVSVVDRVLD